MTLLGPGDVMEFDVDGEPDDFQRDDVEAERHPSCEECGKACCFCPLACEGGEAVEVERETFVHTKCREKFLAGAEPGEDT